MSRGTGYKDQITEMIRKREKLERENEALRAAADVLGKTIQILKAENERLHQERDAWHDLCVHITVYEGTAPIQTLEKEVQERITDPNHKWFQSSTSAGIGTPDAVVKPTIPPNPVNPRGSGKAVSVSTAEGEAPKAEAGEPPKCGCGHSASVHTRYTGPCWVESCPCIGFTLGSPKPKECGRMTKAELLERLEECYTADDTEEGHRRADNLLLEYIGDEDVTGVYNELDRWYA